MYKLKAPWVWLNYQFMDQFYALNPKLRNPIKFWYRDEEDFKERPNKLYPAGHLKYAFLLLTTLLSRLYGETNSTHFKEEWVPLVAEIIQLWKFFNWVSILFVNLIKEIWKERDSSEGQHVPFFMSAYLVDALCAENEFSGMQYKWVPNMPLIHIYCQELKAYNYIKFLYELCYNFIAQVYQIIFCRPSSRLSLEACKTMKGLGHWYCKQHYIYIKVFRCIATPHLIPKYVPDQLIIKETSYHNVIIGYIVVMSCNSKRMQSRFLIKVGHFSLINFPQSKKEVEAFEELKLLPVVFKRHDPNGIIKNHYTSIRLSMNYEHDPYLCDSLYQGALSYDEVLERKRRQNPSQGKLSYYQEVSSNQRTQVEDLWHQEIDQDRQSKIKEKAKKDEESEQKRIDVENIARAKK